jgi:hypothetical protein
MNGNFYLSFAIRILGVYRKSTYDSFSFTFRRRSRRSFTFASAEVASAVTVAGRNLFASVFGAGAISVNLAKSKAPASPPSRQQKGSP